MAVRFRPRRALGLSVVAALTWPGTACKGDTDKPVPGDDCSLLIGVAQGATGCDPALEQLANNLRTSPDEGRCREAARLLLQGPPATGGGIRSVFEPGGHLPGGPLTAEERGALEALPLPARVEIRADRAQAPGVPATTASMGGQPLEVLAPGVLSGHVPPGQQTLELRHAGDLRRYCVTLSPCDELALTAHGAKLSVDARARQGSCEGETVTGGATTTGEPPEPPPPG